MEKNKNYFDSLYSVIVNEHTEKRQNLTYLSWVWAVKEVTERYPDMEYRIICDPESNLPYFYDENTGYMVMTEVTIEGHTKMMWLPVMDSNNKAMKKEPYTVKTRYKEITVNPCTMFDVNKAIMRCLTKNFAMFGLGLYIYAGEDLPESEREPEPAGNATITKQNAKDLLSLMKLKGVEPKDVLSEEEAETMSKITVARYAELVKELSSK